MDVVNWLSKGAPDSFLMAEMPVLFSAEFLPSGSLIYRGGKNSSQTLTNPWSLGDPALQPRHCRQALCPLQTARFHLCHGGRRQDSRRRRRSGACKLAYFNSPACRRKASP
jgi:hypothetical protein